MLTLSRRVKIYRLFEGSQCLHRHGKVVLDSSWNAWPQRWRYYDSSKLRLLLTSRYGVIYCWTWTSSNISTRIWNLPNFFIPMYKVWGESSPLCWSIIQSEKYTKCMVRTQLYIITQLHLGFVVPCVFKYSNKTPNHTQQSVVKFIA
jgi:hypothetical protein